MSCGFAGGKNSVLVRQENQQATTCKVHIYRDLSDATRAGQAGGCGSKAGCLTRAAALIEVRLIKRPFLGVRLRVQPDPAWYWQTAVLDGVSGDPDDPGGTQVIFGAHDGVLVASELAYLREPQALSGGYGKYALGAWGYSDGLDENRTGGRAACCGGAYGLYGFAEQVVYRHATDPRRELALFVRLGFAEARVHQFGVYTGGGLVYTGLLSGRPEDRCGFGVAAAHNSGRFRRIRRAAGQAVTDAEIALELTYRAGLTAWWAVQPSLQYIVNPGTQPGLADAVLVGLRFEVAF